MTAEMDRLRQAEDAAEAVRTRAHGLKAARHAGVAWSGLGPEPFQSRAPEALARDAEARLATLRTWRRGISGRLLAAMVQAERAVERVRACVARGLPANDARCGVALADLERAIAAARQAMDG